MPKIKYVNRKFASSSLTVINNANQIIDDYIAQGFRLTLRQLYYQFVSRGLIPNNIQEYKKLGSIINDARLAGLIDWEAIEDRTRNMKSLSHWNNPSEILDACAKQYRIDKWEKQNYRPQCWIEKDALVGVIADVCEELDITYFSCRGYSSQSEMWSAAQALQEQIDMGQTPLILHLGDHDPSVTGDTPILYKYRGKIKVDTIKKVVDFLKEDKKIQVLALNWKTLKVEFKYAIGYFEHPSVSIYKIRYSGGEIRCTGNHSVYIYDEKGEIKSQKAEELKKGQYLITFCGDILDEKGQILLLKNIKKGKKKITSKIPVDSNLAKIMGYYCAEGVVKIQKGKAVGVHFCFDPSEKKYIKETKRLMKKCFGLTPTPRDQRLYMSLPVAEFFKKYFPENRATKKDIPEFIWNSSSKVFKNFLEGYINGDGHTRIKSKKGFMQKTITTTSSKMKTSLIWLTRSKNIASLFYRRKSKGHYKKDGSYIKESISYNIDFPSSESIKTNKTPMCRRIPNIFKSKKIERKRDSWVRGMRTNIWKALNKENAKKLQRLVDLSDYEKNLISSDLGMARINEVKKTEDKEMVYDITVEKEANFFGGSSPILLHNSGIDMTRDIIDRLQLFMGGVKVERLALNMNQVQQYNPPPNYAKPDDSRYKVYVQNFGAEECWELDALEPQVIVGLIRNTVLSYRDEDLWKEALQEEEKAKKKISNISKNM